MVVRQTSRCGKTTRFRSKNTPLPPHPPMTAVVRTERGARPGLRPPPASVRAAPAGGRRVGSGVTCGSAPGSARDGTAGAGPSRIRDGRSAGTRRARAKRAGALMCKSHGLCPLPFPEGIPDKWDPDARRNDAGGASSPGRMYSPSALRTSHAVRRHRHVQSVCALEPA